MEFARLAEVYEKVEATAARLEITALLSELFKKADASEIEHLIYLSQGVVAPPHSGLEVGMGDKFVEHSIAIATGYQQKRVEDEYRKTGDLGTAAENLIASKTQTSLFSESLTVKKVFDSFMKIAKTGGSGSQELKKKLLVELLNQATPKEARYLVRFPLGRLRLGIGDPTILDALSTYARGDKSMREELERAYNLCSDLGLVAKTLFAKPSEIANFKVKLFSPIRPALAERLPTSEEIIKKIGKCSVEAKYDGFRCQVHKKGSQVEIFSRKLERTTRMFPEIVEAAKQLRATGLILEGEALAYNESAGQYYPFQFTIQRKRKHGIDAMAEQFPLRLFAFDLLYEDGEDYTRRPYSERRKALAAVVGKKGGVIQLSDAIITDDAKELENYFQDSVSKGLEGIIAKDLNSPYVAGARKFAWIKLKRSYQGELADTVDVVIVGYYLGKGKRAEFEFGGLLCAVYDSDEDRFKTIARIGSGFSEEQMKSLQEILSKTKTSIRPPRLDSKVTPDFWVEPKFVITVSADEITRSPMHTCGMRDNTGYALRFPRMVGEIRPDKSPEDATTVSEILQMFDMQKKTSLE